MNSLTSLKESASRLMRSDFENSVDAKIVVMRQAEADLWVMNDQLKEIKTALGVSPKPSLEVPGDPTRTMRFSKARIFASLSHKLPSLEAIARSQKRECLLLSCPLPKSEQYKLYVLSMSMQVCGFSRKLLCDL